LTLPLKVESYVTILIPIEKGKNKSLKKDKNVAKKDRQEDTSNTKLIDLDSQQNQITHRKSNKDTKGDNEHHHHHLTDSIKGKLQEFIGHLDHVPHFLKDNPFIHTGYRINFHTPKKVLKR